MSLEEVTMSDQAQPTRQPDALPDALAAALPVLAAAIAGLPEGEYIILGVRETGRYVQLITYDGGIRCETVGNTYLPDDGQLSEAELGWLAHHGWRDPDECGNHWHEWEPANPLATATVAVVTLHLHHGVQHPNELEIDSEDDRTLAALAVLST
jgi:hypothetical protein